MARLSRDEWAMGLAALTSRRSTCLRRMVGCVLLDADGYVLATGFNGVASGLPHCNELVGMPPKYPHKCEGADLPSGQGLDKCQAIHAEQNALLRCERVKEVLTCYTTASPCMTCVKLLLNTGCQRIVYQEEYPHPEARALWERSGRVWEKVTSLG